MESASSEIEEEAGDDDDSFIDDEGADTERTDDVGANQPRGRKHTPPQPKQAAGRTNKPSYPLVRL